MLDSAFGRARRLTWVATLRTAAVHISLALLPVANAYAQLPEDPFLLVLGIAQDGGTPQAGDRDHPGWTDPGFKRMAVSLAVVDPRTSQRWLFEATPDFREQLHRLDSVYPVTDKPGLDGIFLTHGHVGHYTGLMYLGHESMGARSVPVYAMPRMRAFLETNGPWDQLVRLKNITVIPIADGVPVRLNDHLAVTPVLVPHRQEYTEVVGYRIEGPNKSVLFIPDIDSWADWDARGTRIEDVLAEVDVAFLDATFYSDGEIPGRDMSGFPHPFITQTIQRLAALPAEERGKVRFIHLNHTNPALWSDTDARHDVEMQGFRVAGEMEQTGL